MKLILLICIFIKINSKKEAEAYNDNKQQYNMN